MGVAMADNRPDHVTENADGSVTVSLRGGRFVRMREPTVADQLATKGTPEEREIALIGNLCEVSPDEVRALTLRDYRRLQVALMGFTD